MTRANLALAILASYVAIFWGAYTVASSLT
jgi:hypothetical protein